MVQKLLNLKQKILKLYQVHYVFKDWSTIFLKTGRQYEKDWFYIYEFNFDYNNYNNADYGETIPFIHKYLMVEYGIK